MFLPTDILAQLLIPENRYVQAFDIKAIKRAYGPKNKRLYVPDSMKVLKIHLRFAGYGINVHHLSFCMLRQLTACNIFITKLFLILGEQTSLQSL